MAIDSKVKSNALKNIAIDGRKAFDAILNNDNSQDAVDRMSAFFAKLRSGHNKIEKDEFYGLILHSRKMFISEFTEMFPRDSMFFSELVNQKNETQVSESAFIVEARVHIPEITGMLPLPNLKLYREMRILKKQAAELAEKNEQSKIESVQKDLKKSQEKWYKERLKTSLFPRVYEYTSTGESIEFFRFCTVKFSSSIPTKGIGLLTGHMSSVSVDD
tara:strand:+ start:272 stop:922 length:651 start_codon:yes stop_codon:yes gene_type:complete